ncbi:MAG TPA: hypothetical protein VGD65_20445 [Chryseosolibacter sp.]
MKTPLLFCCLSFTLGVVRAQTYLKAYGGLGYQEHFSIGAALTLRETTSFSLTYGSNFFYKPQDFSALYLQYDRVIPSLMAGKVIPGIGVKAGHNVFTDDFYRWRVISAVPFIMATRKLNPSVDLIAEGGLAMSRIEEVTRIRYGDIGKYKRYLPEVKIAVRYRIAKL